MKIFLYTSIKTTEKYVLKQNYKRINIFKHRALIYINISIHE